MARIAGWEVKTARSGKFSPVAYRLLSAQTFSRMIEALFNNPTYAATKRMMDATALRHEAIASNIANIETPNYKRIDVAATFQDELRQALAAKDSGKIAALQPAIVEDTSALPSRRDGNNVQLESELMHMNTNTLAHALETQLVTGNLLRLRLAITGRPA